MIKERFQYFKKFYYKDLNKKFLSIFVSFEYKSLKEHRILRQKLHQTFTKLSGKDRIKELITTNMNQAMNEIDENIAKRVRRKFLPPRCRKGLVSSF